MAESYDEKIAEWTNRVLEQHNLNPRQAEIKLRGNVNFSTIQNMKSGKRVSEGIVIKFAAGFKEDIPSSLRVFGYNEMAELWETGASPLMSPESREPYLDDLPPELQRVWGFQGEVYNALPPGKARDRYLESLRANALSMRDAIATRLESEEES